MKNPQMVALAKEVIRGAVGVGLEEAGTRIVGPTAWKFAKKALQPVLKELERRYPRVFLVREEAEKAAAALSEDPSLQKLVDDGFVRLEAGQREILDVLASQSKVLREMNEAITLSFERQRSQLDEVSRELARRFGGLELAVQGLGRAPDAAAPGARAAAPRPLPDVVREANAAQVDAMRWLGADDPALASNRLAEARSLLEEALAAHPDHPQLLDLLGYIEKTQAQVAQAQSDPTSYVASLEKAATCFATVLKADPGDVSALNGMANVYAFHGEYDPAIRLGRLAVQREPTYTAALWDLALALERKRQQNGADADDASIAELEDLYRRLEELMVRDPLFGAAELAYVRERLTAIRE